MRMIILREAGIADAITTSHENAPFITFTNADTTYNASATTVNATAVTTVIILVRELMTMATIVIATPSSTSLQQTKFRNRMVKTVISIFTTLSIYTPIMVLSRQLLPRTRKRIIYQLYKPYGYDNDHMV